MTTGMIGYDLAAPIFSIADRTRHIFEARAIAERYKQDDKSFDYTPPAAAQLHHDIRVVLSELESKRQELANLGQEHREKMDAYGKLQVRERGLSPIVRKVAQEINYWANDDCDQLCAFCMCDVNYEAHEADCEVWRARALIPDWEKSEESA